MSKDKFQDKYNEIFQGLKEEKMNWDFEDFLKKTENNQDETPIISINSKQKPNLPKWFWMAASAVIVFGIALFFTISKNNVSEREHFVKSEILKQKEDFIAENLEQQNQMAVHTVDSVTGTKKDSIFVENSLAEKDVLEDILSKRARLKKQAKPRYVQNSVFKNNSLIDSTGYKDSYVIVNGKRIDNMEEAINVTKYSFQVVANNVNQALTPKVMDNVDY